MVILRGDPAVPGLCAGLLFFRAYLFSSQQKRRSGVEWAVQLARHWESNDRRRSVECFG
jgi:hypothetical protein